MVVTTMRTPQKFPMENRPPVMRSDVKGSFANDTMTRRIREEILQRIFDENDWNAMPNAYKALEELRKELEEIAPLRHIKEPNSKDLLTWESIMSPITTKKETWTTAPWLIAEYYFYRRVCEAVAFSTTKYDPFEKQKRAGLYSCHETAKTLVAKTKALIASTPHFSRSQTNTRLKHAFYLGILASLWGNQADLSLWPSEVGSQTSQVTPVASGNVLKTPPRPNSTLSNSDSDLSALTEHLLADDFQELWDSLIKEPFSENILARHIDVITDNAGLEFISDLCLVSILIELGLTQSVTLRVKSSPVFVSDVMVKDVTMHIEEMKKTGGQCVDIAKEWQNYIDIGKLTVEGEEFFCQPTYLWNFPESLWNKIHTNTDLVIVKGDANYRRLTEDRQWQPDFPFKDVVEAFPTRVLALRTLKSESGCGMDLERVKKAKQSDSTWMVDGRWGVLQFSEAQYRL